MYEGYDFLFGSHPDVYILKYAFFAPTVDAKHFIVPSLCNSAKTNVRAGMLNEIEIVF